MFNIIKQMFDQKEISMSLLKLSLVLYGALAAPSLPPQIKDLFENPVFKLVVLFLILFVNGKEPSLALMVAIGFTMVSKYSTKESFCVYRSAFKDKSSAEAGVSNVKILLDI